MPYNSQIIKNTEIGIQPVAIIYVVGSASLDFVFFSVSSSFLGWLIMTTGWLPTTTGAACLLVHIHWEKKGDITNACDMSPSFRVYEVQPSLLDQ